MLFRSLVVRDLSDKRGPASQAQLLYVETEESRTARQKLADQRRWGTEPSLQLKGRPTKRNRRLMEQFANAEADPADDA